MPADTTTPRLPRTVRELGNITTCNDFLHTLTASHIPIRILLGRHTDTGFHFDICPAGHNPALDATAANYTRFDSTPVTLAPCCGTRPLDELANNLFRIDDAVNEPAAALAERAADIIYLAAAAGAGRTDIGDMFDAATFYARRANHFTGQLDWLRHILDEHCTTTLANCRGVGPATTLIEVGVGAVFSLWRQVARDTHTRALWARSTLRHPGRNVLVLADNHVRDTLTRHTGTRILLTCNNPDELDAGAHTLRAIADNNPIADNMVRTVAALHPTTRTGNSDSHNQ
jgi:hypothetical protein